jgi:pyruvate/2-oxoglutarate dehydrogenase complex dihydrolipoamide acyltransferase (E2) component
VLAEDGTFDDEVHDEETGEVIAEKEPEPEAKPKRTRRPAAEKPEPEPEPEPEPAEIPADAVDAERDEMGLTKSEEEARADDYIDRARKCEFLVDFRKLEREAEMDLAEMPVHIAAGVDREFGIARTRLTPRREK